MDSRLNPSDIDALLWAADKADEWYGNVTGDEEKECLHISRAGALKRALRKLGITWRPPSSQR